MTDPIAPLWITPAQAAARLNEAESTIRSKVSKGLIPHHRSGRFLRFTEQDLADYIALTAIPATGGRTRAKKPRTSKAA